MSNATLMSHAHNGRVEEKDPAARPKKRVFTPEYKLQILEQLDKMDDPSARAAFYRREGLYSSHIAEWRKARDAGALQGLAAKPRAKRSAEQIEIERLRRKNARLENELERTKLALEITGKAHALLEALSESAAPDEPRSKP
jgi:transposase-like protein